MQDSDILYGSKSGIQKAVRRGNLNLAKTCFDILWADKITRAWLKWRTPVLVAEEAWYFAGELGDFIATDPGDDENAWRKFIYRLVLIPKCKDAHGLWECAAADLPTEQEDNFSEQMHKERQTMSQLIEEAGGFNPGLVIREAFTEFDKMVGFSDYEKRGMQQLISRAFAGGMISDKWMMLASIVLFASRPVEKEEVLKLEKKGLKNWKTKTGNGKPQTVNLPWYIFDMHTQAGKIALGSFVKRKAAAYGITNKKYIDDIWFYLGSAYVPPDLLERTGDSEAVIFYQTFWWPIAVIIALEDIPDFEDAREIRKLWPKLRKDLEGLVNWILEKRDQ